MQSRSWGVITLAAVAAALALPSAALAAPPANDEIQNATALDIPDIDQGTNVDATSPNEINTPADPQGGCRSDDTIGPGGTKVAKTVWYTFIGTGEPVTISVNLSGFDTVLFVYSFRNSALVRETCNDDIDAAAGRSESEAVVGAEQGVRYYVQLGGCCGGTDSETGQIFLTIFPPPDNDLQANAQPIGLDNTVETFTLGALEETGERLSCATGGTRSYAKTVWYRFSVPALGDVRVTTGGFPTAAALYRAGSFQGCASAASGNTTLNQPVTPGEYLLQVGGIGDAAAAADGTLHTRVDYTRRTDLDGDGFSPPADCDEGNAGIHPGAPSVVGNGVKENCVDDPPDLDKDNDGINDDVDCNDDNPAIHQGAAEILGNKVDENCDRKVEDYGLIRARYSYFTRRGHVVRFRVLRVKNIPKGATLRLTCKGKGCNPKRKYTKRFAKARSSFDLLNRVRRHRLRKGAVVEIRITSPGKIGRVFRVTALADGNSKDSDRCLRPGAKRTTRCP
jgi:hypothetical protein